MSVVDQKLQKETIEKLHNEACEKGEMTYQDPFTDYVVFTKLSHLQRGYCCQSGCRHCPWKKIDQKTSK
ncbi:MAG: DUF5522 domain-containing protein [Bacillota bacterium]